MGASDDCGLDRAMREVGDGASKRTQAVSGGAIEGEVQRMLPSHVGLAQEGTGGGGKGESVRAGRRMGQQARIEEGKRREKKTFFFLFSRVLATLFKLNLNSIQIWSKPIITKIKVQQHVCMKRLLTLYLILISQNLLISYI